MTREEAIKFLKLDKEDRGKCFISDAIDVAIKALEQEPRKGHWIETSLTEVSGGDFKRGFKCSHCNYVIVTNDFNFCPNCGADMREVEV